MSVPSHSGYSVHAISRICTKDELSVRRINRLNIIIISLNIDRYRRHLEIGIPENPAKIETNRFCVETSSKKTSTFPCRYKFRRIIRFQVVPTDESASDEFCSIINIRLRTEFIYIYIYMNVPLRLVNSKSCTYELLRTIPQSTASSSDIYRQAAKRFISQGARTKIVPAYFVDFFVFLRTELSTISLISPSLVAKKSFCLFLFSMTN